jgi:hypothetical protein
MSGPFDGALTTQGKIATVTKRYAICPHCEQVSGCQVDHLYQYIAQGKEVNYTDWDCHECGLPMDIRAVDGELVITKNTNRTWDLVELVTKDGQRLRLLLDQKRWEKQGAPEDPDEVFHNKEYWYNEGTCPTNWTGSIETMILEDDTDPHGVFHFIATVDQDKAVYLPPEKSSTRGERELDLFATFPEQMKDLEPEEARTEFMEIVPDLLLRMIASGNQVSITCVKGLDMQTPERYVINVKEKKGKDGVPNSTQYGITIPPIHLMKYKAI